MELLKSVAKEFFIEDIRQIELMQGGIINQTYYVCTVNEDYILQKIAPIVTKGVIQNCHVVTTYLNNVCGWRVPDLINSRNGSFIYTDSCGDRWRAMLYIPHDTVAVSGMSTYEITSAAALLGKFHAAVATISYIPKDAIKNFHDIDHIMNQLQLCVGSLNITCREIAADLQMAFERDCQYYPSDERQIIHGDPQLSNILFSNSTAVSIIDFDTVMQGSKWIDIGDFIRSVLLQESRAGRQINEHLLRDIAVAYISEFESVDNVTTFMNKCIYATKRMVLELTARFLIDIHEDKYFEWDVLRFESRKEHNQYRASEQWQFYDKL